MGRSGEKIGWVGGWFGSMLFLPILGIVFMSQHQITPGAILMGAFVVLFPMVFMLAPWHHPATRYWKLMLPFYVVFIAAGVGAALTANISDRLSLWQLFTLSVFILPFFSIGAKTWNENQGTRR